VLARRRLRLHLGLLAVSMTVMAALGCNGGDGSAGPASPAPSSTLAPAASGAAEFCAPCPCASASVVDPSLMAFLSKARSSHHEADLAEQDKDQAGAIRALGRLVTGPIPGGNSPSPEVREVLADSLARLAELRSATGDFDAASSDIDRGLSLAVEPTHFRGRLMEMRGLVEERRAKALEGSGDRNGARAAKERALDAYTQAIDIQDQVIRDALRDAGAPGNAPSTAPGSGGPAGSALAPVAPSATNSAAR